MNVMYVFNLKLIISQKCPVWSEWSEYGDCSVTCGSGIKTRSRECENGEAGELGCHEGGISDSTTCNTQVRKQQY